MTENERAIAMHLLEGLHMLGMSGAEAEALWSGEAAPNVHKNPQNLYTSQERVQKSAESVQTEPRFAGIDFDALNEQLRGYARQVERLQEAMGEAQPIVANADGYVSAPKACDMGEMCLDCQPRGPNGECPDQAEIGTQREQK